MTSPAAVDLLAQAINHTRPMLTAGSTNERVHTLWAAAKKARDLGAADVIHDAFMQLAIEVDLIDPRGHWTGDDVRESERRHGAEDISHVLRWAQRGWNPFGTGPLK